MSSHLRHTLSFVNHDLYGPTAMLRNYLHAVASTAAPHAELAEMVHDAEELVLQLEGLIRVLQDSLRLQIGNLECVPAPLDVGDIVTKWCGANPAAVLAPITRVRASLDAAVTMRMLDYAAFQLARMGDIKGDVTVGCASDNGVASLRLGRPDGRLSVETLQSAALSPLDDWERTLRRLPACGLPLRTALALCVAQGGQISVENLKPQGAVLVLAFAASAE